MEVSATLDDPPEIPCKDLARIACIKQYLQESYNNGVLLQVQKSGLICLKYKMKQSFANVTLPRPFGDDHSCRFLNRRETLDSQLTVKFCLQFCREKQENTQDSRKNICFLNMAS